MQERVKSVVVKGVPVEPHQMEADGFDNDALELAIGLSKSMQEGSAVVTDSSSCSKEGRGDDDDDNNGGTAHLASL